MEPYVGEIRLFGMGTAPQGWALCNGAIIQKSQNSALENLLKTQFGGESGKTFALPDLRGRVPFGTGKDKASQLTISQGDKDGAESVALSEEHLPAHTHTVWACTDEPDVPIVINKTGAWASAPLYGKPENLVNLSSDTVTALAGGGQKHTNMQPFLVLNFCIALTGLYPQPT